jgi:hypothetical protein
MRAPHATGEANDRLARISLVTPTYTGAAVTGRNIASLIGFCQSNQKPLAETDEVIPGLGFHSRPLSSLLWATGPLGIASLTQE